MSRGDVNFDGEDADPVDLSYLVDFLFSGGPVPLCEGEADVNGDGNAADGVDLSYFVDFLFNGGSAPVGCPLLIFIDNLEPGDAIVRGHTRAADPSRYRVVIWAKTDRWYVQPSVAEPYTVIQSDGTFENTINPWTRIAVLLVDSSYVPEPVIEHHPSSDPGVVAWDEYPEKHPDRYIDWSSYRWRVKNAELAGPGPNHFSDDTSNVAVDPSNRLHLEIVNRSGTWYCSEILLDHSLGYGRYTFKLDSRVDSLNYNVIFSGFIYETVNAEFDIEFSQFLADPFNAQYVAQPWDRPGNITFFNQPNDIQTSHSFEWRADSLVFQSWVGHADSATSSTLIHSWIYTGPDIPIPGNERIRFNLYLAGGNPPTDGTSDEVIISSFKFAN